MGSEGQGLTNTVETRKRMDHVFPSGKNQGVFPSAKNQGDRDDIYTELWYACAGSLVYVPRNGEKVFYFPQGHIEQVEVYTNQDGKVEMPIYNLPSKILCKVVYVQLKAEATTDEAFAQITLLPETLQDELSLERGNSLPLPRKSHLRSFSKKLTPSDRSTHGGFSVPKRPAEECLPPLDMSQEPPVQDLVAKDLLGCEWRFRHIYRGQPKRHLLTSGWSTFVSSKKLVAGDACIFLRGENGEVRVGVRRAMNLQKNASTSIISAHSMQHGILASAFHAISSGTLFTVYYRPWTSPSEFIIPFNQYMKAAETDYTVGMRFRMQFESEECVEQRIAGTVVGTEDIDHIRWPDSEWRCLKVKWDATSDAFAYPDRVSPWNIEPIELTNKKNTSVLHRQKRFCARDPLVPRFSGLVQDGLFRSSVEHAPLSHSGVLQGQESGDRGINESRASKPPLLPHFVPLMNPDWAPIQLGLENQLHFPMHDTFYQCPSSSVLFSGGNIASLVPNHRPSAFTSYFVHDNAEASRNFSVPNVNSCNSGSQDWRALELRDKFEAPLSQPNSLDRYMLFGVNLFNNSPELPSPQVATSSEFESLLSVPPISQSSVSETIHVQEPSKSTSCFLSEFQCKNCCSVTNRSCTKVLKYGTALGRSVDLTRFDGYEELICELDRMFDFKGSLIDGSSEWHVAYSDYEGDMMLIGDYPWQDFQYMVQRMFICPKEDTDN